MVLLRLLQRVLQNYMDATLSIIVDTETAEAFLSSLNESHSTMEFGELGNFVHQEM